MKLFVVLGLLTRRVLSAERRDRLLHLAAILLGYRILAWDSEQHRRQAPPHDPIEVVKIALKE